MWAASLTASRSARRLAANDAPTTTTTNTASAAIPSCTTVRRRLGSGRAGAGVTPSASVHHGGRSGWSWWSGPPTARGASGDWGSPGARRRHRHRDRVGRCLCGRGAGWSVVVPARVVGAVATRRVRAGRPRGRRARRPTGPSRGHRGRRRPRSGSRAAGLRRGRRRPRSGSRAAGYRRGRRRPRWCGWPWAWPPACLCGDCRHRPRGRPGRMQARGPGRSGRRSCCRRGRGWPARGRRLRLRRW